MDAPDWVNPQPLDRNADLQTVLTAWHDATLRLEHTHEALRSEVRRLTDELEAKNRELARKNRLADLGLMASHVAHEVRNNLVPAKLYLSLLRRRLTADQAAAEVADKAGNSLESLETMINDLLSFTADRDPQQRRFSVRGMLEVLLDSLRPQLAAQNVRASLDAAADLTAWADEDMLRRAVLNLLLNALDAMPGGGQLWITAVESRDALEIEVADSGPGLNDDAKRRAFEPFFTTKSHGTGLGLALVQRMAELHGGHVRMANCPEGGAAFTLHLPQPRLQRNIA